jgi:hypothetical protein
MLKAGILQFGFIAYIEPIYRLHSMVDEFQFLISVCAIA